MKYNVRIEYDGKRYVAYCTNLIGCYVQSHSEHTVKQQIQEAISLYINTYEQRSEPFHPEADMPQLNYNIKFKRFSSEKLSILLVRSNYVLDLMTDNHLIFRKADFPFFRIVIPNADDLSPIIIKKIFGEENVTLIPSHIKRENIKYRQG